MGKSNIRFRMNLGYYYHNSFIIFCSVLYVHYLKKKSFPRVGHLSFEWCWMYIITICVIILSSFSVSMKHLHICLTKPTVIIPRVYILILRNEIKRRYKSSLMAVTDESISILIATSRFIFFLFFQDYPTLDFWSQEIKKMKRKKKKKRKEKRNNLEVAFVRMFSLSCS